MASLIESPQFHIPLPSRSRALAWTIALRSLSERVEKLERLVSEKEKGELSKYTKKERLLIDRDIEKLRTFFFGISVMKSLPQAIFVVDSKKESIAVKEAQKMGIPVVALCGTDNNLNEVEFPIPANDSSKLSIEFFLGKIAEAYKAGQLKKVEEVK